MRRPAGLLSALVLLVPAAYVAAGSAGAATLPTCKSMTGTQTYSPALPKLGNSTKVNTTISTTAKISGCSGGGVTGATVSSKTKYTGNCKSLLSSGATITGSSTFKWNTGQASTAASTLTRLSAPGASTTLVKLSSAFAVGLFKGTTATVTLKATAPAGGCRSTALSKFNFVSTGSLTFKSSPTGTNCPIAGLAKTVRYRTIAGVDANSNSLDVYSPAGVCNAPVVLWVHGGGYEIGDKSSQVANKVTLFNKKGWVFASINYRLTVPGDPSSAHFPDHFDDVAAAVAWVKSNIGRYGGNPSRVAMLGHSAGADIVSNVANNPVYLAAHGLTLSSLRCVGPLDTEGFDKPVSTDDEGDKAFWLEALGNDPNNFLTDTSASYFVKSGIGIPRTISVYRGNLTRQQIEKSYIAKLSAAGVATSLIDARSLTHNEVNTQIGAPGDTVMTAPLVSFLTSCFA